MLQQVVLGAVDAGVQVRPYPVKWRMADGGAEGSVWGVLLAAGASSRMGRHKLLLDFGGEALVRRAARALLAGGVSGLVAVTGRDAPAVEAALAGLGARFAHNPDFAAGELASSIAVGLAAVPEGAAGALVMLSDMPFVGAAHVRRVLAAGGPHTGAVMSAYGAVTAPPHLVPAASFGRVRELVLAGERRPLPRVIGGGARAAQPGEDLLDVDDEASYAAALARLAAAPTGDAD